MSKKYEVGYKKPPVNSRFKKGQSGNRTRCRKVKARLPSAVPAVVIKHSASVKPSRTIVSVGKSV